MFCPSTSNNILPVYIYILCCTSNYLVIVNRLCVLQSRTWLCSFINRFLLAAEELSCIIDTIQPIWMIINDEGLIYEGTIMIN